MTVYVDDAAIRASVPYAGRVIVSRWYHLIADDKDELHAFARQLGLARSWFQDPMKKTRGITPSPTSLGAQHWHYDVTEGMRKKAIQMGAKPVTSQEMQRIFAERHAKLYPQAARNLERRIEATFRQHRLTHPDVTLSDD